jgi:hypothetical protein
MEINAGRGNWMQTYTGVQFYLLDPTPEEVVAEDIARALSMICRYGGHAHRFYSVAEHCVLMSEAVPEDFALWALLHDAAEAYVGDMVRPLKKMIPAYSVIENHVLMAILEKFGVVGGPELPLLVKSADDRILQTERAILFHKPIGIWETQGLAPLPVPIYCWDQPTAEQMYLDRLHSLLEAGK